MALFYDTCALLSHGDEIFEKGEEFYISSITSAELEHIKNSANKDEQLKYRARNLLRLMKQEGGICKRILYKVGFVQDNEVFSDYELNNDIKIMATALMMSKAEPITFITDDLSCHDIAAAVGLNVEYFVSTKEEYTGIKEIDVDEEELAEFYSGINTNENRYGLLTNQYLILRMNGEIVGQYVWTGNCHEKVNYSKINSDMFGKIGPYKGDIYQQCAIDSLKRNQMTVLRGPAGSGKSLLALAYLYSLLEHHKIEKIVIFCNTVATKGAAKLGYYPGDKYEKLLDAQIGNFLSNKLGGIEGVYEAIERRKLEILPMADIRGVDLNGESVGLYITEAQNTDIELMRLCLQRAGEDSVIILDGDDNAQVDLMMYEGQNNGLSRVCDVFKGQDFFGEITLQKIYRSKIANIAQLM